MASQTALGGVADLLGDILGEEDADLNNLTGEGGGFRGQGLGGVEGCLAGEEDSLDEDKGEDLVGVDDLALNGGDAAPGGDAAVGEGEVADWTGESTWETAGPAVWTRCWWGVPLQEDSSQGSKGSPA